MKAMVFTPGCTRLQFTDVDTPEAVEGQVLIKVSACGVCRTDLHVVDGELPNPKQHLIPGHEIVGYIAAVGGKDSRFKVGQRVGVPWLGETCGHCIYCQGGQENLCDNPRFTGYTVDGGYAEYVCASEDYCFSLPELFDDVAAAPLLCDGLIGYRSLRMAGAARRVGIYGFGAAAHIIAQVARFEGRDIYAFTRPGDRSAAELARKCGAVWTGDSTIATPVALDAAIIFAPVGALVPAALAAVRKGGVVVCGGIHMSDIPSFSYDLLWGERMVRSVANLTRRDAEEFLQIAPTVPIHTETTTFALSEANTALEALRNGKLQGAAVLVP